MKKILLVSIENQSNLSTYYPPLGILKISAYHKQQGNKVLYTRGIDNILFLNNYYPDEIYISTLFTYYWRYTHQVIDYYVKKYPKSIIKVGGIYASLCPQHLYAEFKDKIHIHQGLLNEVEDILPDYTLVPKWKASIVFSQRGCIRGCPFCAVNKLEPQSTYKKTIKHLIHPDHNKIIFFDNNFISSPYYNDILEELKELNKVVDFNQGLDGRLITEKVATQLRSIKLPIVRIAYDVYSQGYRKAIKRAIDNLKQVGYNGKAIIVYIIHNTPFFKSDTPDNLLNRIKDCMEWGVACVPMRYEPLEPYEKSTYVSPQWTQEQLNSIPALEGYFGYGGGFAPHNKSIKYFLEAKNFDDAFNLDKLKKEYTEQTQSITKQLTISI
jgi:hypothetical protein